MSLDLSHVARHVLITGLTGYGKSTLARSLAQKSRAPWKFAFETYKREFSARPPHGLGWAACIDRPSMERALFARRPAAFYFGPLFPGDRPAAFNFWSRWVYEVGKKLPGTKELYIDEMETVTEHVNCPLAPAFKEIVNEGRAYKFDLFMICQRLSETNRTILSTAKEMVSLKHVDESEFRWLRDRGIDPAKVTELERGDHLWRDRERGTERIHYATTRPPQPARAASRPQNRRGQSAQANRG
jgi:energy-coupling factor transporter ATP-binding protein EcfA2